MLERGGRDRERRGPVGRRDPDDLRAADGAGRVDREERGHRAERRTARDRERGGADDVEAADGRRERWLANPTLDLADPGEQRVQLDDWLQQIALDAGLSGMEDLLAAFHQDHD